jgi:hypothetical protein
MDKIERMDLSGLLARHLPLLVRIRPLLREYPPILRDTPSINVYSDYLTAAEQGKLPGSDVSTELLCLESICTVHGVLRTPSVFL